MNVTHPKTHNQSPFQMIEQEVADIYLEAKNFLDGEECTAKQEPAVERLLTAIKDISKRERALFKATKEPHATAAKAVDETFNPLKKRLEDAKQAAQAALTPLRVERENARREEQRQAQALAEQKTREAQELAAQTSNADLAAREIIDAAESEAKRLNAKAGAISRQATGLRRNWTPHLTDISAAARHYYTTSPVEFEAFLQGMAVGDVRSGAREIPGFDITEIMEAR